MGQLHTERRRGLNAVAVECDEIRPVPVAGRAVQPWERSGVRQPWDVYASAQGGTTGNGLEAAACRRGREGDAVAGRAQPSGMNGQYVAGGRGPDAGGAVVDQELKRFGNALIRIGAERQTVETRAVNDHLDVLTEDRCALECDRPSCVDIPYVRQLIEQDGACVMIRPSLEPQHGDVPGHSLGS